MDAGTTARVVMDVEAYLRRIRYNGPHEPSFAALRDLHRQHLWTVPFENLDIALGTTIHLESNALFRKIVVRRRGGFCYELNGLFSELLLALGFRVEMLSARVRREEGGFGPEFDHMLLKVTLDEPWIADVGFGDSFLDPLPLRTPNSTTSPGNSQFWIRSFDGKHELIRCDGDDDPIPQYRFTDAPRELSEFAPMCVFHQTSPDSHFTQGSICSKALPDGRISLARMRLITTRLRIRKEAVLENQSELRMCLQEQFGIEFGDDVDLSRLAKWNGS